MSASIVSASSLSDNLAALRLNGSSTSSATSSPSSATPPSASTVKAAAEKVFCGNCEREEGPEKFKQCARCNTIRYCSKECQSKHWKIHKTACRQITTELVPTTAATQASSPSSQVDATSQEPKEKRSIYELMKSIWHGKVNFLDIDCEPSLWNEKGELNTKGMDIVKARIHEYTMSVLSPEKQAQFKKMQEEAVEEACQQGIDEARKRAVQFGADPNKVKKSPYQFLNALMEVELFTNGIDIKNRDSVENNLDKVIEIFEKYHPGSTQGKNKEKTLELFENGIFNREDYKKANPNAFYGERIFDKSKEKALAAGKSESEAENIAQRAVANKGQKIVKATIAKSIVLEPNRRCHNTVCTADIDAESLSKCTRCQKAMYCGAACQKAHWKEHKKVCQDPQTELSNVVARLTSAGALTSSASLSSSFSLTHLELFFELFFELKY